MLTILRSGTTEDNNRLRLTAGELSFDDTKKALRLHDDQTLGGFEILGERAYVLPTGPGPEEIVAGDETLGYYGRLATEDFVSGDVLASMVGLSMGSAIVTDEWFKFARNGKVLYIPVTPIRSSISWEQLYQAGLVYGVDGPGPYPSPTQTPVNQATQVSVQSYPFIVRLMTTGFEDPITGWSGDRGNPPQSGGEWNDLLYRVASNTPLTNAADIWDNVPSTVMRVSGGTTDGKICWCQETYDSDTTKRFFRGSQGLTDFYPVSATVVNQYYGWRPVLELVK